MMRFCNNEAAVLQVLNLWIKTFIMICALYFCVYRESVLFLSYYMPSNMSIIICSFMQVHGWDQTPVAGLSNRLHVIVQLNFPQQNAFPLNVFLLLTDEAIFFCIISTVCATNVIIWIHYVYKPEFSSLLSFLP